MINMIKIELKKFKLLNHLLGLLLVNIFVFSLILLIDVATSSSIATSSNFIPEVAVNAIPSLEFLIDTLLKSVFVIWKAILIATIIIEEIKSKTINTLFSYPINRKKIIAAKLIFILLAIATFMIITYITQYTIFYFLAINTNIISSGFELPNIIELAISSIATIMIGMAPLYFGTIKKSIVTTILSSIIIISITGSTFGQQGGLISILPVAIALGVVGVILAHIALVKIVGDDL